MKLRRMISLLLALVLMASAVGTVSVSAENVTEYKAIESFQVSTDDAPVPYYMGAAQLGESGNPYYFLKGGGSTSKIEGYSKTSLPTTKKVYESTPVYIERVSAGYRLYYMKDENKSYIAVTSGGVTNNQKDQTDDKNTFSWDAENKVFYQMDTVYGEKEPVKYVLAIYADSDGSVYNRITAERWDNYTEPEPTGARVYPVSLYEPEAVGIRRPVEVDTTPVTQPAEGTPYFFCVNQEDKGKNGTLYYWVGRVVDTAAALFLEVTTDNGRATVVYLENTGTGWKMTQMLDGKKQYLYLYRKGSDMALGLVDEAKYATDFQWNEEYNTLVADYFGTEIFMGVNTDMNEDGTVKTPYTKIKPLKTTVLGQPHRFASFLIAVPEGVEAEVPPRTETEAESATDPEQEVDEDQIPAPKTGSGKINIVGLIAAAILMAGGVTLVILDKKKNTKESNQ